MDLEENYFPYVINQENKKIEKYLTICSNPGVLFLTKNDISNIPKISIISPVYNTGKFVLRLLKSIQYQNFKDLEIILIDDCSEDNSFELIKKYQKEDKRIQLIKNNKNKGTFSSRNIGILKSKGNYVMLPDPDDILLENCIKYFYYFSIKHKYELVRFNVYLNFGKTFFEGITNNLKSRPIFQPELSTYLFYGLGYLKQVDFNVCNKFIKRETLIRGLNMLNKTDLNLFITIYEDGLLNYFLYRAANSAYFLKRFGYYYIRNNYKKKVNYKYYQFIYFKFMHLIYVFNYSKNNQYERDMANNLFDRLIYQNRKNIRIDLLYKDIKIFVDIINILNQNDFFAIKYKNYLKEFIFNSNIKK